MLFSIFTLSVVNFFYWDRNTLDLDQLEYFKAIRLKPIVGWLHLFQFYFYIGLSAALPLWRRGKNTIDAYLIIGCFCWLQCGESSLPIGWQASSVSISEVNKANGIIAVTHLDLLSVLTENHCFTKLKFPRQIFGILSYEVRDPYPVKVTHERYNLCRPLL